MKGRGPTDTSDLYTVIFSNDCRRNEQQRLKEKMDFYKKQAEELEYSLKVLIETGTIIPKELDSKINRVLSGKSLQEYEE